MTFVIWSLEYVHEAGILLQFSFIDKTGTLYICPNNDSLIKRHFLSDKCMT